MSGSEPVKRLWGEWRLCSLRAEELYLKQWFEVTHFIFFYNSMVSRLTRRWLFWYLQYICIKIYIRYVCIHIHYLMCCKPSEAHGAYCSWTELWTTYYWMKCGCLFGTKTNQSSISGNKCEKPSSILDQISVPFGLVRSCYPKFNDFRRLWLFEPGYLRLAAGLLCLSSPWCSWPDEERGDNANGKTAELFCWLEFFWMVLGGLDWYYC